MKFTACSIAAALVVSTAAGFTTTAPSSFGVRSSVPTALEAARKPFISGNWKLNPQTKQEAIDLAKGIAAAVTDESPDADVALFVPYVFIETAMEAVGGKVQIGAEVRSRFMKKVVFLYTTKEITNLIFTTTNFIL